MENHQESTQEIFCPLCMKKVHAQYFGIEGIGKHKMHRYECPNEQTPGERHGIYQAVIEESPATEEYISPLMETHVQDESPVPDEEPVLQGNSKNFSAKENSWINFSFPQPEQERTTRSWVSQALGYIGIYETLKAIFSSPKPEPTPEGDATGLVAMHHSNHDFLLPNHEEPMALLEVLPTSVDDIPDLDDALDFSDASEWFEGFVEALNSF